MAHLATGIYKTSRTRRNQQRAALLPPVRMSNGNTSYSYLLQHSTRLHCTKTVNRSKNRKESSSRPGETCSCELLIVWAQQELFKVQNCKSNLLAGSCSPAQTVITQNIQFCFFLIKCCAVIHTFSNIIIIASRCHNRIQEEEMAGVQVFQIHESRVAQCCRYSVIWWTNKFSRDHHHHHHPPLWAPLHPSASVLMNNLKRCQQRAEP